MTVTRRMALAILKSRPTTRLRNGTRNAPPPIPSSAPNPPATTPASIEYTTGSTRNRTVKCGTAVSEPRRPDGRPARPSVTSAPGHSSLKAHAHLEAWRRAHPRARPIAGCRRRRRKGAQRGAVADHQSPGAAQGAEANACELRPAIRRRRRDDDRRSEPRRLARPRHERCHGHLRPRLQERSHVDVGSGGDVSQARLRRASRGAARPRPQRRRPHHVRPPRNAGSGRLVPVRRAPAGHRSQAHRHARGVDGRLSLDSVRRRKFGNRGGRRRQRVFVDGRHAGDERSPLYRPARVSVREPDWILDSRGHRIDPRRSRHQTRDRPHQPPTRVPHARRGRHGDFTRQRPAPL